MWEGLFAILDTDLRNLLSQYLYNERGFTTQEITVCYLSENSSNDAELFEVMKEQINKGNPVIYFGSKHPEIIDRNSSIDTEITELTDIDSELTPSDTYTTDSTITDFLYSIDMAHYMID